MTVRYDSDPVDIEIIEYVDTQEKLEVINKYGIVKPNAVLVNGRQLRMPAKHPVVVERIGLEEGGNGDTVKVTLTLFVRKASIEARIAPPVDNQ